ncbi:MAG: glycosyltransferase family 2 protein [Ignavibacteriaceae bacterium]
MIEKLTVFLPYSGNNWTLHIVNELKKSLLVENIFLLAPDKSINGLPDCRTLYVDSLFSLDSIKLISKCAGSNLILLFTKDILIELYPGTLERLISVIKDTNAGIVYSDFYETKSEIKTAHPLLDYHLGSIRDDFDFGSMVLIQNEALSKSLEVGTNNYLHAGLYNSRLWISENYPVIRIREFLYELFDNDLRDPSEKHFDYVVLRNRAVQEEMEKAATEHLKRIGAYLTPEFDKLPPDNLDFEYEASVIIPVKDRANTICDAVESVLKQKTNFPYNLIVVDNHSTDGTSDIIKNYALMEKNIIHIIPANSSLGIGGCWNEAVSNDKCGRYCIQLDSDDIYYDENTLQKFVDLFRSEKYAMIIGSYKVTDFNLNELPPGIVSHKEWTSDNGRNNALRINGLGAPRAFYTPLIREIKFPNVSYGEDYAVCLKISRNYQIGRIYDPVYICRRWHGNSDAALSVEKQNLYNSYKDWLRANEILSRQKLNSEKNN